MKNMMAGMRSNPPATLGGEKIIKVRDLLNDDKLPKSNVLQFYLESGTIVSARPSGTEPKIKFYTEIPGKMECAKCYDGAVKEAEARVELIKKDLGL